MLHPRDFKKMCAEEEKTKKRLLCDDCSWPFRVYITNLMLFIKTATRSCIIIQRLTKGDVTNSLQMFDLSIICQMICEFIILINLAFFIFIITFQNLTACEYKRRCTSALKARMPIACYSASKIFHFFLFCESVLESCFTHFLFYSFLCVCSLKENCLMK